MNPTPLTTESLARRSAVLTGLGFASGFGWLWFPALQDWWLPLFLWGTPWSGGGVSLFYLLLAAGFWGCGLYGRYFGKTENDKTVAFCNNGSDGTFPLERPAADFRLTRLLHWVHGLSLALMALAMTPSLFAPLRLSGA